MLPIVMTLVVAIIMFQTKAEAGRNEIVQKRLDVFMFLLVRGWIEAHVEYTDSRKIRKLLDAACILLQDGKEADILLLSDFDYVLEEKKELSYEIAREKEEKERTEMEEKEKSEHKTDDDNSNGFCDMEDLFEKEKREEETKKKSATELEIAQHARDYTKFVSEHTEKVALPIEYDECQQPNLPKITISKNLTETRYIGDGVFVQRPKLILADKTPLSETILHRALSLCLRDVSPKVFRHELEETCKHAHGGFMRLYISEPDPERDFCRQAIASFWANANVMKICWALRARQLHTGHSLNVIEYRDFSKRIDLIDGLASDKSIVLRDIQLCKNLIEFLDRRHHLWCAEMMTNPLLNNLDECLTFHLQQLIQSGQIKEYMFPETNLDLADIDATTAEAENPVQSKNVDRDENLIRILDRLILYLRIVHSIDYYGCKFHENEGVEYQRVLRQERVLRGDLSAFSVTKLMQRLCFDRQDLSKCLMNLSKGSYACTLVKANYPLLWTYERRCKGIPTHYEPRRIGLIHLRGPCYKQATPRQLADHIRNFEENLQLLLPSETRLADEHAELLGKRKLDYEEQKFIDSNIIGAKDGLSKCCLCYKRFTSLAFAQDHLKQNHFDTINEHKLEITAFNNYLYDPNRLCHIAF
uniref:C2H2-type domain-containing protein n=1 Tax=Romanomermis culicivorax TaxID=13658 RepID=A0A915KKH9_ROMCU